MVHRVFRVFLILVVISGVGALTWFAFQDPAEEPSFVGEVKPARDAGPPEEKPDPPPVPKRQKQDNPAPLSPSPEKAAPAPSGSEERMVLCLVNRADRTPLACVTAEIEGNTYVTTLEGKVALPPKWRFKVSIPGYVISLVSIRGYKKALAEPIVVPLARACTIQGVVLSAGGRSVRKADIRFALRRHRVSLLNMADNPPSIRRGYPPSWTASLSYPVGRLRTETDDAGRFCMSGFPPDTPVHAAIQTGVIAKFRVKEPVVLQPGEVREVVWTIPGQCYLLGVVRDQGGRAVADAKVWLHGGDAEGYVGNTDTDKTGNFSFGAVRFGSYRIEVESKKKPADFPVAKETVTLTTFDVEVFKTISVFRNLFIRGRVVGPGGEPLKGIQVSSGRSEGDKLGYFGTQTESRLDGSFDLGPLVLGAHEIRAEGWGKYADAPPMQVQAGTMGVEIRLPLVSKAKGKTVDSLTGKPVACNVQIYRREFWAWYSTTSGANDGVFEFGDLEPGTYDVFAVSKTGLVGGRGAVQIREGDRLRSLVIRVSPSGTLVTRIRGTGGKPAKFKLRYKLTVWRGGETIHSEVVKRASSEIRVPAGRVRICLASLEDEHKTWTVPVDVVPGERREVNFTLPD